MLAELGVAVTFRVPGEIFQPQQPQRHAAAAQLLLGQLPIRQRTVEIAPVGNREQSTVELLLAKPFASPPSVSASPAPPKGARLAAVTCRAAAMPKPNQGAENAEIGCRIGAKSGAAFRRNHLPISTEIRCRFAPIFASVSLQAATITVHMFYSER